MITREGGGIDRKMPRIQRVKTWLRMVNDKLMARVNGLSFRCCIAPAMKVLGNDSRAQACGRIH